LPGARVILHKSKSGLLEGRKLNIYTGETILTVDAAKLLENAVTGAIIGRGDEVVERFIKDAPPQNQVQRAFAEIVMPATVRAQNIVNDINGMDTLRGCGFIGPAFASAGCIF
jgi:hypothetical protein